MSNRSGTPDQVRGDEITITNFGFRDTSDTEGHAIGTGPGMSYAGAMISFDFQPVLTDDTLSLRPLRAEDWDALYAVASDPAIWTGHPASDRWQEASFRAFFEAALASGGALVMEDGATGALIGSSRFDREFAEEDEVEIGWTFLARAHWGGSVNAAAKRLMIGHALATYQQVMFRVGEDNVRSRRAMEKIGGRLSPRTFDVALGDRMIRHVAYVIDRAGFASGPLARCSA